MIFTVSTLTIICILLANLTFVHSAQQPLVQVSEVLEDFDWSALKPRDELEYHKCYDGLECARLLVPLDWTNLSNPNDVALAIARLPARVKKTDAKFGGTILINPGGPSGSGVDVLRYLGRNFQDIVDGDKSFEILSWDPRGTRYTTPSTACFETDEARSLLALQSTLVGTIDSSFYAFNTKWASAGGVGKLCSATAQGHYDDGSNIRQFVSTALVAHDMVAIIDQVQEEEIKQAKSGKDGKQSALQNDILDKKGPALLNYWGLSYGTYLGNTFASMFPSRIGRMVLDGVVDAPDYAASGWTSNLQDNNRLWNTFYQWCFEAGSKCALKGDFPDAVHMQFAVEDLLEDIKEEPFTIIVGSDVYIYTHIQLVAQLHASSYGPFQTWPLLAVGLAGLLQKDPIAIKSLIESSVLLPQTSTLKDGAYMIPALGSSLEMSPFNNRTIPYPPGYPHSLEAGVAIACGDGKEINKYDKTEFANYILKLRYESDLIGPLWAEIMLRCRHWPSDQRPADRNRFIGPFRSNLSDYDSRASPLLFVGNTADPVTPVRNAFEMARHHEGASVLVLDAPGHCTHGNMPSKCIWNSIKAFFNSGTLPKSGTVCPVDWKPWDNAHL